MELLQVLGFYHDTVVADSILYAVGNWLTVYDIHDPDHPLRRGEIYMAYGGETATGIALKGTMLFIPVRRFVNDKWTVRFHTVLKVVDVSDPERPAVIKETNPLLGSPGSVSVSGNTLLLQVEDYNGTSGENATLLYDVWNPAEPYFIRTIEPIGGHSFVDGLLYAIWPDNRFGIMEIVNAYAPDMMGRTNRFYNSVAAGNGMAYGVVGDNGSGRLDILDTAEPATITLKGSMPLPINNPRIAVDQKLAAIGSASVAQCNLGGIKIVDVQDPSAPVLDGWYNDPAWIFNVDFDNRLVFVATSDGLKMLRYKIPPAVGVSGISRAGYQAGVMRAGKPVYADRDYVFQVPMGRAYSWRTYIVTKNNDKNLTGDNFLNFTVDRPTAAYVGLDARITTPPAWLREWMKLADVMRVSDPGEPRRILYKKTFPAGKVTLGANRDALMPTGNSMYSVLLIPAPMSGVASKNLKGYE